jgi:16S rRNA (adenine1518-N6/adenine1519-N6)-dimethyltransferase
MSRQRLGQHFLADSGWRERIAREIGVSRFSGASASKSYGPENFCWIDLGAGQGEMTEYLASTGALVFAIELDAALAESLRRMAQKFPNVTVISCDILKTDLAALAGSRRMHVYGNLPYYITSPILHHLFHFAERIDEIHVVIQTEVALRLTAVPRTKLYGYLSVVTQLHTRPELIFRIPRGAFRPPPEVGSALVSMRLPGERAKLGIRDEQGFLDFVKLCFSQKRKTLVNNLRSLASRDIVREALASLQLRSDARAEQLSVAQLAKLFAKFSLS